MEGIAQALKEDTSKKYSDEGLGLVETLKKRYARLALPCRVALDLDWVLNED